MRFAHPLMAALALSAAAAQADTFTGRVVADDHYLVFTGDASGASLTLVSDSGSNLWFSQGSAFSFDAAPGDYLYVAAWDSPSYGAPHMWMGEFSSTNTTLYSNLTDWVAKYDGTVKFPTLAQVSSLAQTAAPWQPLLVSMANGSSPYGNLLNSSPAAMVWHDAFGASSASESGYALFRSAAPLVSSVPEPSAPALVLGAAGVLALRLRRQRDNAPRTTPL